MRCCSVCGWEGIVVPRCFAGCLHCECCDAAIGDPVPRCIVQPIDLVALRARRADLSNRFAAAFQKLPPKMTLGSLLGREFGLGLLGVTDEMILTTVEDCGRGACALPASPVRTDDLVAPLLGALGVVCAAARLDDDATHVRVPVLLWGLVAVRLTHLGVQPQRAGSDPSVLLHELLEAARGVREESKLVERGDFGTWVEIGLPAMARLTAAIHAIETHVGASTSG